MHFGENQLSQSLIGLSPLSTAHPPSFQPRWVRSSTRSYTCFNLAMDRSLRFGSRSCHYNALFRLAFATTTPHGLTSRQNTNSQAHSSKGTPPPHTGAITACKHTVSGTLSLPSRGTFHHSLTVLIRYRSSGGIQAAEWSRQTHTGFHEPHATLGTHARNIHARFHLQGSHLLRPAIPDGSATQRHSRPAPAETRTHAPHNPAHATPAEYHTHTV